MVEFKGFKEQMQDTAFKGRDFDSLLRRRVHERHKEEQQGQEKKNRQSLWMAAVSVAVCGLFLIAATSLVTENKNTHDPVSGNSVTKQELLKAKVLREANTNGEVVSFINEKRIFDSKTENLEYMLRLMKKAKRGEPFKTTIHYIYKNKYYKNSLSFDGSQMVYKNTVPALGERKVYQCKALGGPDVVLEGCTSIREGNDVPVLFTTISDRRYAEAKEQGESK